MEKTSEEKWEQRRFEVAKEIFTYGITHEVDIVRKIVEMSVEYADTLIAELRKNESEKKQIEDGRIIKADSRPIRRLSNGVLERRMQTVAARF